MLRLRLLYGGCLAKSGHGHDECERKDREDHDSALHGDLLNNSGWRAKHASRAVRPKAVICAEIAERDLNSEDLEADVPGDRPSSRVFGWPFCQDDSTARGEIDKKHEKSTSAREPECCR